MSSNPFNNTLDWALQGKYARVRSGDDIFVGWIDRVHHNRGSVVLHDATIVQSDDPPDGEQTNVGSVFVRTVDNVVTYHPKKTIDYREVATLKPYPDHDIDFTPRDDVMRRCYRNQFSGSFPVIRPDGTIINGHKRIAACKAVGLDTHPVEVVEVTDEQADELFRLAHRSHTNPDGYPDTDE